MVVMFGVLLSFKNEVITNNVRCTPFAQNAQMVFIILNPKPRP